MAKIKQPLLSFDARRKLGDDIVYSRRRGANIVESKPYPADRRSPDQLSWRHMFLKVVALWHALSAAEKETWESAARSRHMTGYAWFVSKALRPNPGIYLPLQGGTMTGDIDMVKNRILRLPLPADGQEPVTLTYFNDNLPVGGYTEGARVYHSVNLSIPTGTQTALTFDSERYDTDNIHGVDVPLSRLKCNTAGKYAIGGCTRFADLADGTRCWSRIRLNGATGIASAFEVPGAPANPMFCVNTVYDLEVNDYVELTVAHFFGVNRDITASVQMSPEFWMQRIG